VNATNGALLGQVSITVDVNGEMWLQLVGEYMLYRNDQPAAEALHTASCRLLLDIMPGLETSVIFQDNVCTVANVMLTKDMHRSQTNWTPTVFWHNFARTNRLWIIFGREDQEAITY